MMWIIVFLTLALLCFVIAKGCNEDEKIFTQKDASLGAFYVIRK